MNLEDVKILIGDDSIVARKQIKDIVYSFGANNIIEAANGQEAIDLYNLHIPDIVFLDIVMPVKDGNSAISEIMEANPEAYIVVISSVGTQSQLRQAISLGAKDFVQKPINSKQIESILITRFEGRA